MKQFVVKMVIAKIVSPLDEKEKGAKAGRQIWGYREATSRESL